PSGVSWQAIAPLTALGLETLDGVPRLLHRAGHETPDGVPLPLHPVHDFGNRGPVFALQHLDNLRGFAALAWLSGFLRLRGRFSLGRGLGGGGLLGRLALRRRALGGLCATRGLL